MVTSFITICPAYVKLEDCWLEEAFLWGYFEFCCWISWAENSQRESRWMGRRNV